ncbi:tetratricopeptide repeat-containing glycosyltransferase family 2 protein [Bacillus cereus]|uniref:Glycosyl transferase n=1 Tax=Bacillus cereus TaxID=1396 RepID=A0A9X6X520_BACCE|nr:glycosyltransferase family 2 protein [Bacillus cereus]PFK27217.1 glycosyl transferase [Bacillus cereus]
MISISLCMIVKNEEANLGRCLQSIEGIADEIIIVDTGSTDNTKEIARKFTKRVYDFQWIDDFSAARNESFRYAQKEYILWLDADDVIESSEVKLLKQLKKTLDVTIDAVSMKYHVAFSKQGQVISSTRRIRLVKRTKPFYWSGIVHEDLKCQENYSYLSSDITVVHTKQTSTDANRNVQIYERAVGRGYQLSVQDMFHYARELTIHKRYKKAIEMYEKCLDSPELSLENKTFIYHQLASCYALIGNEEKEQELTIQSFLIDIPQPVFCCRMGEQFLNKKQYEQAVFWYELAIQIKLPQRYEWSISQQIYQTWLPHKQLGLCYYQMGDYRLSYIYNKKVLTYLPDDKATLSNLNNLEQVLCERGVPIPQEDA